MNWLMPSLISTMTGTFILSCLYLYLYFVDREEYLLIWTISWFLYTLRFAVAIVMVFIPGSGLLAITHQLITLASGIALLSGTYAFVHREPWALWTVSSLIITAWIFISIPLGMSFMAVSVPTFFYLGAVYAATGTLFLGSPTLGNRITGITFILWGIHKANYPFLRPVEWFAPWGFLLASAFSFTVAIGTLIIYFEHARRSVAQSEARYRNLFDLSADPIVVIEPEPDGRLVIQNINEAAITLLGYDRAYSTGRDIREFMNDDSGERVEAVLAELFETGRATIRIGLTAKNGATVTVDATATVTEVNDRHTIIAAARDITQHLAMMRQQELSATIVATSTDAIFTTDSRNVVTSWNPAAERIFGYAPMEIIGVSYNVLVPQEDLPNSRARFEEFQRTGESITFEAERLRKDGSPVYCAYSVSPVRDADGTVVGATGIVRDITDQRRAERRISMLTGAIEQLSDRIIITDEAGIIRYVNATFERETGFTADTLIGTHLTDGPVGIPDPAMKNEVLASMRTGRVFRKELTLTENNGTTTPLEVIVSPIRSNDGTVTHFIVTGRDISDRVRMRREIINHKRFNERVVEAAGVIIVGIDKDGIVRLFNPYAETVSGYDAGAVINRSWTEFVAPEHRSFASHLIPDILAGKVVSGETEYRIVCRDGSMRDVSWRQSILTGDDGEDMVLATGLDITIRKKIQASLAEKSQQLEDLNHTLEERVKYEVDRRERQERMMIQQSKISAMGDMMSAIAHQWRQPLSALGIYIQDLEDAFAEDELTAEYLQLMIEKSMRLILMMSETIDDFRDFFRPSEERELFDVNAMILDLVNLIKSQIDHDTIGLSVTTENGHGPVDLFTAADYPEITVTGYSGQFKQVLLNLISNARDAVLHRRTSEPDFTGDIAIHTAKSAGIVSITVEDTADGISSEVSTRIFEPYFTTRNNATSTGLGLYMSKLIVEQHMGGVIRLDTDAPHTRFTVHLKEDTHHPASRIDTDGAGAERN